MALPVEWTKHIPRDEPEQKADFESVIRNSRVALGRIKELIDERLASLNAVEFSEKAFDNPNWASLQAYRNGRARELKSLQDLLSFLS